MDKLRHIGIINSISMRASLHKWLANFIRPHPPSLLPFVHSHPEHATVMKMQSTSTPCNLTNESWDCIARIVFVQTALLSRFMRVGGAPPSSGTTCDYIAWGNERWGVPGGCAMKFHALTGILKRHCLALLCRNCSFSYGSVGEKGKGNNKEKK